MIQLQYYDIIHDIIRQLWYHIWYWVKSWYSIWYLMYTWYNLWDYTKNMISYMIWWMVWYHTRMISNTLMHDIIYDVLYILRMQQTESQTAVGARFWARLALDVRLTCLTLSKAARTQICTIRPWILGPQRKAWGRRRKWTVQRMIAWYQSEALRQF